jgi:hypothetical protein
MPAEDAAAESDLSARLFAQGSPAILELCSLLVPAGRGDDVAERYALSGLSAHVTRPGADAERRRVAADYLRALDAAAENEVRAFLIRQLEIVGDGDAVAPLGRLLREPVLVDPAAQALVTIGGSRAAGALLGALGEARAGDRVTLVQALGELRSPAAYYEILKYTVSEDEELRQAALHAVAEIGPVSPAAVLLSGADQDSPYRRAQADASLLRYAERLAEAGEKQQLAEIAHHLIATRRAPGEEHVRRAALDMLVSHGSGDARRAWVVAAGLLSGDAEASAGFTPLFNGRDLQGWTGDTVSYSAQGGRIVIDPEKRGGGGNLDTEAEYGDFALRFEFKLTPGANNGLGIRAPLEGDAAYEGMELQILDNGAPRYANLAPYQYHGSIYGVVAARRGFQNPVGEWNSELVVAAGRHVIVILNGAVIVDADLDAASTPKTRDGRSHPGLARSAGHIGFLGHGSEVEFRHIELKDLTRSESR